MSLPFSVPSRSLQQTSVVGDENFLTFLDTISDCFDSDDGNVENAFPSFPINTPLDIPIDTPIDTSNKVLDLGVSSPACDFLFYRKIDFSSEVVTTHVDRLPKGLLDNMALLFAHGGPTYDGVQSAAMRYNFDDENIGWFESMRILFNRYCIQYLGDIQGDLQKGGVMEQEHVFIFSGQNNSGQNNIAENLKFFTVPVNHKITNFRECLMCVAMGEYFFFRYN